MNKFRLVPVPSLDAESQLTIRSLRNDDSVRKWMFKSTEIELSDHLVWLQSIKDDATRLVLAVVSSRNETVGIVSFTNIDLENKTATWAFYLRPTERGGLGSALELAALDFAFGDLGLLKLECQVIEGNLPVLRLHDRFGFSIEGFRKSCLIRNNTRIGAHLLGLTTERWSLRRPDILSAHAKVIAHFQITIETQTTSTHPLDIIEKARARNNLNWMAILRLAIDKSPTTAIPLVMDIRDIDRRIGQLTDELISGQPGGLLQQKK
jgi:UDP-4-amino-4,6-dideoxy-N-acetyl-beta-L-altrosamine N-acetyltransferase